MTRLGPANRSSASTTNGSRPRTSPSAISRPLRRRARALRRDAAPRHGRDEGRGLQPDVRGPRLGLAAHRRRVRQRRHAVPRRLGHDGARPPRVSAPPGDPPGRPRAARRRGQPHRRGRDRGLRRRTRSRVDDPRRDRHADRPGAPDQLARTSSACSATSTPPSRTGPRCGAGRDARSASSTSRSRRASTRRSIAEASAPAVDDPRHFTFLGYREYEFVSASDARTG